MAGTENYNPQKKSELAFGISCHLGEGPVWDERNKRILWVDIIKGEIHWFFPDTGEHNYSETGQLTGAIALTDKGDILAALQTGFVRVNLNDGSLQNISDPESNLPDNRFNDGKCDPAGRFWAGTVSMSGTEKAGSLYTLEHDLSISTKVKNVTVSNGMAWSPDGATFYFIDTPTKQVVAYDYDNSNGSITNKRIVVQIPLEEGYPDGMAIDTEGMLWIALWDGWKVGRWNPQNGELIESITLPVSRPTSCVFGGDKLQDLYITSACYGLGENDLSNQPLAGSLFVLKNSGYQGLPVNEFRSV
ncbi:MAG: SMP-30/gluconolactonase/LRE family protein [Daejeonella sp.]